MKLLSYRVWWYLTTLVTPTFSKALSRIYTSPAVIKSFYSAFSSTFDVFNMTFYVSLIRYEKVYFYFLLITDEVEHLIFDYSGFTFWEVPIQVC